MVAISLGFVWFLKDRLSELVARMPISARPAKKLKALRYQFLAKSVFSLPAKNIWASKINTDRLVIVRVR